MHFKPWALFKRDRLIEGMSPEEAQREWRAAVMNPNIKKMKVKGQ